MDPCAVSIKEEIDDGIAVNRGVVVKREVGGCLEQKLNQSVSNINNTFLLWKWRDAFPRNSHPLAVDFT